jgi:hypothetical protein
MEEWPNKPATSLVHALVEPSRRSRPIPGRSARLRRCEKIARTYADRPRVNAGEDRSATRGSPWTSPFYTVPTKIALRQSESSIDVMAALCRKPFRERSLRSGPLGALGV